MAVVQVNENTLDFIFDESVNNYTLGSGDIIELFINSTKFYYYDENNSLIELPFTYENDVELGLEAGNIGNVSVCSFMIGNWMVAKFSNEYYGLIANTWYVVSKQDESVYFKTKGFRIENFTYAEGQTLETINELVIPYIGTKTSFAKTYTLKVNGKTLNTINGKKIRNLIYKGTTYEIVQPTSSGYTLTMNVVGGDNQYLDSVAYTTNNGETYTDLSPNQVGTAITINNVVSITFKDTWPSGFFTPDAGSAVKIGTTSGGGEYGYIVLSSGNTITIDLTQDTTIYVQGFVNIHGPII